MVSERHLLFFSRILINLVVLTIAQPPIFIENFCINTGNYTSNSTYESNLNTLLSSLSSNIDKFKYGFYNSSVGENSDKVNAIAFCRGDANLEMCRNCIHNSTTKLIQLCPNYKEAIAYYDYCMLRFSNNTIIGIMSDSPQEPLCNSNKYASNMDQYNQVLRSLLDDIRKQAAAGGPLRKLAAGNTTGPDFQIIYIYALEQCTPDLSERDCFNCLLGAAEAIPSCNGSTGVRILRPSCFLQYETYNFFNEIPAIPPPASPAPASPQPDPPGPGDVDIKIRTIIIVVISTVISMIGLILCVCIIFKTVKQMKQRQKVNSNSICEVVEEISTMESLQYNFNTIRVATNNFSDANKLGQGGFGVVYKGRFPNGKEIAVKRLSQNSSQGELEFKNEVMLLAKLQHRNLVKLLGFGLERIEKILIYEFVTNLSLDHFIFDSINHAHLDWDRRYKIIGGIARGLLYLHEDSRLRIIHRDLKTSNVLLDAEMNPKISDFGLARLFVLDETQGNTSRVVGTNGYMAPEYIIHGQFSVKSDVFSFGVLVLEIVSGRKNNYFHNEENENLLSY
ncbi:Cysteine-rich receptor-like protein kinase 26, partial [Camellia lanceoleosa]